jgi:hypothetical protein
MGAQCNASWSESVPVGNRGHATMILHHGCLRVLSHDGPHQCTCDPVYELRTDFVDFAHGGVWRRE